MSWEVVAGLMEGDGYVVEVVIEGTQVKVGCEKGGIKLSSLMSIDMVEQYKGDLIERVLMSQKNDLDAALAEKRE